MAVDHTSRTPEAPFAPLPLRARGALELLDASLKLYRQYFGALFCWSLLIQACTLVGSWFASILLGPILVGASVCCLAAAVRGQRVTFKQCWEFTKPRYGALVGITLLAGLILGAVIVAFAVLFGIAAAVGFGVSSGFGLMLIGLLGLALLIFLPYASVWAGLVPTVICFEDDKRNTSALRRAYDLPRGHWNRIVGLAIVLGLAVLAVGSILFVTGFLLVAGGSLADLMQGSNSSRFLGAVFGFSLLIAVLQALVIPLFQLCLGLYYLDVRVRKEALDLEWAAHASAPAAPAVGGAPGFISGQPPHYAPPGYAPQSFAPAPQPFAPQVVAPQAMPPQAMPPAPQAAAPMSLDKAPAPPAAAPPAAAPSVPVAATVACLGCGAVSPHGQRFCMTCGAQLPAS